MKVFILGKIRGVYRTQQLIKSLLNIDNVQISYMGFEITQSNRILSWISKVGYSIQAIALIWCCDIVFVPAMQHDTCLLKIAKALKKKIIVDYYISYYDTFVLDRKELKESALKSKRLYKRDKYALLNADRCLFLNNAEKEYYCKVADVKTERVNSMIIPLVISPKKKAHMDYFAGKRDTMNLCWTGSYIPLQGLDKIIKMMTYVKQKNLNCHLYIWGDKDLKAAPYLEMIRKNHLEKYITVHNEWGNIKAWQDFIISKCDVCMGIFGDSEKAKTVCANKVVDGVAFGTPVITAYSKGVEEFFADGEGIYFTSNIPEDIFSAVYKLYSLNYEKISVGLENSMNIYNKVFSVKAFEDKLNKALEV